MNNDSQLLQGYLDGSEPAFRELVARYVNLVYSAALRHLGDAAQAEDVVQTVFTALARKAGRLPEGTVLGGWLYRHTCFVAAQCLRTERRRLAREREAVAMNVPEDNREAQWEQLSPLLEEAMQRLRTSDRDAVVLRFFENRNLRSVGESLGISEEAARKRIARGLEKLRVFFSHRGASLSTASLATLLGANAVTAAPPGLAVAAGSAALAAAATGAGSSLAVIQLFTMSKLKIGIVGAFITAAVVTTVVSYHQSRSKLRAAEAAQAEQATRQTDLEAEHNRLAALAVQPGSQSKDLVRLRGEVQGLRQEASALPGVQRDQRRLQAAVNKPSMEPTPEQEQAVTARMNYGKLAVVACMRHAQSSGGLFPSNLTQVSAGLPNPTNAQTDPSKDAFELVYSGTFKGLMALKNAAETIVIRQRQPSAYGDRWAKVYVCADGHCEIRTQADPDFSEWEAQHMITQPSGTP
jgi:RNA polymerase sigma factor (sigma-70 family)